MSRTTLRPPIPFNQFLHSRGPLHESASSRPGRSAWPVGAARAPCPAPRLRSMSRLRRLASLCCALLCAPSLLRAALWPSPSSPRCSAPSLHLHWAASPAAAWRDRGRRPCNLCAGALGLVRWAGTRDIG
ncbi:hypothetical protein P7K49_014502 [Saguinus oedipus]|uniref:Uncharacterized protein n=1 Tax=Saguinus oedipus TaxID=9490 RepID=A0ABQ9VJ09_SAGOE|nr:hypothetical protein P7K49_014502 [Saguinus oedipus]